MQIIRLDLDHSNFFCPATGKPLFDEGGDVSPAVDFAYFYEVGEIDHASTAAQAAWDAIEEDEDDSNFDHFDHFDHFERFVDAYDARNLLCFEITTHGFACGPVTSTVSVGIDMNYDLDETSGVDVPEAGK
jgi:hypothetical protein